MMTTLYRLASLTLGTIAGLLFRLNRPEAARVAMVAIGLARKGWGA